MRKIFILLFLSIPFANRAQDFELKGEFKGENTKQITLKYIGLDEQGISDTLRIIDGKFSTVGQIKGTQRVLLLGNISSRSIEDPNLGYFFLEPGEVEIKLEENNFKTPVVKNSPTQAEYAKIYRKSSEIVFEVKSLLKKNADRELIDQKWKELKDLELSYAAENPSSLLSSFYVDFYKRQIQEDSLRQYYQKMSNENKNSIYGEAIHELLYKEIVNTHDDAPYFEATDLNGKKISLKDFEGKYLLIDFWANWCAPCLQQLPELKSLYQEYENRGLDILGVSFDANKALWRKAVDKHNIQNWNHVFVGMNNIGTTGSISEKYNIQPIPAYILIGKEGKIIGRYSNASEQNKSFGDLALKLKELLEK